jgi:hypothetical protein
MKNVEWRTILKAAVFTILLSFVFALFLPRGIVGVASLITAITLGAALSKTMRAAHGILAFACYYTSSFILVGVFAVVAAFAR